MSAWHSHGVIDPTPKELRRLPRVQVELTAERRDGDVSIVDRVLNLSVSGLMVLSQYELKAGSIVALKLDGEGADINLTAAVVWTRQSPQWPGLEAGLKLIGMTSDASARLELLITGLLASRRGRRSSVRFGVALGAHWRTAGAAAALSVDLIDLSLGGAMISGANVPEYGDRGLLSLDFGEGIMATAASVVWRDLYRVPAAAGLSFDPGPEVSEFVAKIVRAVLLTPRERPPGIDSIGALFDSYDAEQTQQGVPPFVRRKPGG